MSPLAFRERQDMRPCRLLRRTWTEPEDVDGWTDGSARRTWMACIIHSSRPAILTQSQSVLQEVVLASGYNTRPLLQRAARRSSSSSSSGMLHAACSRQVKVSTRFATGGCGVCLVPALCRGVAVARPGLRLCAEASEQALQSGRSRSKRRWVGEVCALVMGVRFVVDGEIGGGWWVVDGQKEMTMRDQGRLGFLMSSCECM
ncbi:hypothetical protein IWZ00DRAFT_136825 [Phyllosticta capitalensis]